MVALNSFLLFIQTDRRALGFCEADVCCQNKTDEAGRKSCTFGEPRRFEYREEHPRCGTNGTCEPSVCDHCFLSEDPVGCFTSINAVCNGVTDANGKTWKLEGCYRDYPGYPNYQAYRIAPYCELAKCIVDGGTEYACSCQLAHARCEMFGDTRLYAVSLNE